MSDQSHDSVCCQSSCEQVVHHIYQDNRYLVQSNLENFRTQSLSQIHKNVKFPSVVKCRFYRELKPDTRMVRSMESSEQQELFQNHTTDNHE